MTPLKNFPNPPELQCFGFNLTNVDIIINKGFLQINANYIKTEDSNNLTFCRAFENMLKSSPEQVTEYVGKFIPGLDKLRQTPGFDTVLGETMDVAKKSRPLSKAEKKRK